MYQVIGMQSLNSRTVRVFAEVRTLKEARRERWRVIDLIWQKGAEAYGEEMAWQLRELAKFRIRIQEV